MAVGAGETIGAFIVFGGALGHTFAGSALVGGKFGDCAVVAAVGGAGQAGEYLLLKDVPMAFAYYFHLGFVVVEGVEKVDVGLC